MCTLVVEITLLHSFLPRLIEMENIGEHLHHILVIEEGDLQQMMIISDQHLLDFQDKLHNMLITVHNMEVVAQNLTTILMISWICNKTHIFNNIWKHIWNKIEMHAFNI